MDKAILVAKLRDYFKGRKDVAFAYLFGSVAKDRTHSESDIDIGVYFTPATRALEYESEQRYPDELKIWDDLENITDRQTDMVVLNRAPASLFYAVMREGISLRDGNEDLKMRMYLAVSFAAEDYYDFTKDYFRILERSHSLSLTDQARLRRLISFLEQEIQDYGKFTKVTQERYMHDRDIKRNFERWAESIAIASIDIAKILLASEKKVMPESYRAILENLVSLDGFDRQHAKIMAHHSSTRNLIAHEYLDLRFVTLSAFVKQSRSSYEYLIQYAKGAIKKSEKKSEA